MTGFFANCACEDEARIKNVKARKPD